MKSDRDPIVAIATAPGRGGVGIVRLSASDELVKRFVTDFFAGQGVEVSEDSRRVAWACPCAFLFRFLVLDDCSRQDMVINAGEVLAHFFANAF